MQPYEHRAVIVPTQERKCQSRSAPGVRGARAAHGRHVDVPDGAGCGDQSCPRWAQECAEPSSPPGPRKPVSHVLTIVSTSSGDEATPTVRSASRSLPDDVSTLVRRARNASVPLSSQTLTRRVALRSWFTVTVHPSSSPSVTTPSPQSRIFPAMVTSVPPGRRSSSGTVPPTDDPPPDGPRNRVRSPGEPTRVDVPAPRSVGFRGTARPAPPGGLPGAAAGQALDGVLDAGRVPFDVLHVQASADDVALYDLEDRHPTHLEGLAVPAGPRPEPFGP